MTVRMIYLMFLRLAGWLALLAVLAALAPLLPRPLRLSRLVRGGWRFGQCEHPGVAQQLLSAAQLVVVADVADDERVEGTSFAAGQAASVEDGGDFGVGVAAG